MSKPLIRIFADLTSQPARAVIAFCKFNHIPHQVKLVRILRMENTTDQYSKINPLKKVPSIMDLRPQAKNFTLFESHAILRYLCRTFPVASHWYPPDDIKKKALIDQYLDLHHAGFRKGGMLIFYQEFLPKMIGKENADKIITPEYLGYEGAIFNKTLDVIENAWLGNEDRLEEAKKKGEFNFITGVSEKPTLADLSAACELVQYKFMPHRYEEIMSEHPHIKLWLNKMMSYEEMVEAHQFFERGVKKFLQNKQKAKL